MKEKPNEWIAISDLMAGITGVVILMLVVSVVMNEKKKTYAKQEQEKSIQSVLKNIKMSLDTVEGAQGIVFNEAELKFTLPDQSFRSGCACINSGCFNALKQTANEIEKALVADSGLSIQIDGHSDAAPVRSISADKKRNCALYDDNYTLSAGRAREARNAILRGFTNLEHGKRISVVGYGPDRLINPEYPLANENRRVEVSFIKKPVNQVKIKSQQQTTTPYHSSNKGS